MNCGQQYSTQLCRDCQKPKKKKEEAEDVREIKTKRWLETTVKQFDEHAWIIEEC